ncbi:MAG TPA: hypothetical protein VFP96_12000, partial [Candidatus Acidoferrum sp.]|nr:hypothetical protein [Candidatus Acidoferrum sp.]
CGGCEAGEMMSGRSWQLIEAVAAMLMGATVGALGYILASGSIHTAWGLPLVLCTIAGTVFGYFARGLIKRRI